MSGFGRGALFDIDATAASSISSEDTKDKESGLGTNASVSTAEYRKVGRGKLLEDISSGFSSLSLTGRGRGQFSEIISSGASVSEAIPITSKIRANRGKVLMDLLSLGDEHKTAQAPLVQKTNEPESVKLEGAACRTEFYRPDITTGSKGTPVRFACNYIKLSTEADKGVYVYEVRFIPNVDSRDLRSKYLNEHRHVLGGAKIFDGVTLYLPFLLKDELTTFVSKNTADNSDVEVRVLFKKKEALKNCLHLYNVLFDRIMKVLKYVRFDRKQFDPTAPKIIPQAKLEVWPGYVTAVSECEGGLMLCCDASHRVLCQQTVLQTLADVYHSNPANFQDNAKKTLLGAVVITRYNNRTYKIDDILFDQNPLSTFQTMNGPLSYVDYYKQSYNIYIKDHKQPLLLSIKKQRGIDDGKTGEVAFCLVPEICHLTGLQDNMRSDFKLMREIASFTRVSPNERLRALEKFYDNINNNPDAREILSSWGLSMKEPYLNMNGRQLDQVQIMFAKGSFSAGANADFGKFAGNNELLEVVHLKRWMVLYCLKDTSVAKSFIQHMQRNARFIGVEVASPKLIALQDDRTVTYVEALRNQIEADTQIVVCICPSSRDDRYAAIKKVCCVENPIPSQVINARTLSNENKNKSIVQKIALQMNCKLGGTLWSVNIPLKKVMICGFDTYHDAGQKGDSVAAFVASLDASYTKWYSKAVIQKRKEELGKGLCASFVLALGAYESANGELPEKVVIYRDGVGDGQLPMCKNFEIPQLEAACAKFPNYKLNLTFIVIQKRVNTRIFAFEDNSPRNPLPGSVIDSNITRPHLYDFYLVSQSVRQGTVSPTHFIVLRDDSNYKPDTIQRLSYKLCFMYYNWPGTVRVPACCQYAHKMAHLVGYSIKRQTSEDLSHQLFYL